MKQKQTKQGHGGPQPKIVRVLPDIAALDRTFDYKVPKTWSWEEKPVTVGTRVRVVFHSRRVTAWVVATDPADSGYEGQLQELKIWSGYGPDEDIVDLCKWVATRWCSNPAKLLATASPPKNVKHLPSARTTGALATPEPTAGVNRGEDSEPNSIDKIEPNSIAELARTAFSRPRSAISLAPAADRWPFIQEAIRTGNPLILAPTVPLAEELVRRLTRQNHRVALWPRDWALAKAGAITVGTRSAAFASVGQLGSILVLDEYCQHYRSQQSPTWHAVSVTQQRCRSANISWVGISPSVSAITRLSLKNEPSPEVLIPLPALNREGWPNIEVIDRSLEPPGRYGLFSRRLVDVIKKSTGRVACILNRTDRVKLLACSACNSVTSCMHCGAAVVLNKNNELECRRCSQKRPPVCSDCASIRLKNIVLGISKAREELEALIREPVGEHSAEELIDTDARVVLGTDVVLNQPIDIRNRYEAIIFLDFDQHLFAIKRDAEQEALELLARAARQLGPRRYRGSLVIQTRAAQHQLILALKAGSLDALGARWLETSKEMGWPPSVAQAKVSSTGATEFMAALKRLGGSGLGGTEALPLFQDDKELERLAELAAQVQRLEILEVAQNDYEIRTAKIGDLVAALSATPRPKKRLRIAVY